MQTSGPSSSRIDSKDEFGTNLEDPGGRDQDIVVAVAGPSKTPASATKLKRRSKSKGSGAAAPVPLDERKSPSALGEPSSFENNGDFIAFGLEEDEPDIHEPLHREAKGEPRERERDRGKDRARERDDAGGRKRKAEFDRNDGYSNKRERTNAASRKAPWVADVDWEGSMNVADLYAFFFHFLSALRLTTCRRLNREVEAFVKYISPTREEDEIRSLVVALISEAIAKRFPDAKVLAFGSYETKLYLPLG
jgi:non-canonical poly(A) RNA polymerase PAPD5/7